MTTKISGKFAYSTGKFVSVAACLLSFIGAQVSGIRANWYEFGIATLIFIFSLVGFVGISLSCKIDARFDAIEKLVRDISIRESKDARTDATEKSPKI